MAEKGLLQYFRCALDLVCCGSFVVSGHQTTRTQAAKPAKTTTKITRSFVSSISLSKVQPASVQLKSSPSFEIHHSGIVQGGDFEETIIFCEKMDTEPTPPEAETEAVNEDRTATSTNGVDDNFEDELECRVCRGPAEEG